MGLIRDKKGQGSYGFGSILKVLFILVLVVVITVSLSYLINYFYQPSEVEVVPDKGNLEEILESGVYGNKSKEGIIKEVIQQGDLSLEELDSLVEKGHITEEQKNNILRNSGLWYWMKYKVFDKSKQTENKFWTGVGWILGFNDWQGNPISLFGNLRFSFSWSGLFLWGLLLGVGIGIISYFLIFRLFFSSDFKWRFIVLPVLITIGFYLLISFGIIDYRYLVNVPCDLKEDSKLCFLGSGMLNLFFGIYVLAWMVVFGMFRYVTIAYFESFSSHSDRLSALGLFVDELPRYVKTFFIVVIIYVIGRALPITNRIFYFISLEFLQINWVVHGFILAAAIYFFPMLWPMYKSYYERRKIYRKELRKQAILEIGKVHLEK